MKTYPSIQAAVQSGKHIYAFDKLDGSNIRVMWNRKDGFHRFGTRNRLLSPSEIPLGEAMHIFKSRDWDEQLLDCMHRTWKKKKMPRQATFYFEFHGDNSFAGNHKQEWHWLTLIDVNIYKQGFIDARLLASPPWDEFGAKLLYQGNANQPFVESVRQSQLEGMTFEGVVCKAGGGLKRIMFKVKSTAWLQKLRGHCKGNEELYKKLM